MRVSSARARLTAVGAGIALVAVPTASAAKLGPPIGLSAPGPRPAASAAGHSVPAGPVHIVTGSVTAPGGMPLGGACVIAIGPAGSSLARTAPDGRYSISLATPGAYMLQYRVCGALSNSSPVNSATPESVTTRQVWVSDGMVTMVPAVTLRPGPASAAPGQRAELERAGVMVPPALRLLRPGQHAGAAPAVKLNGVSGKVTDPHGRPLKGICVWVTGNGWALGTSTSARGTYRVESNFQPGLYPIEFTSNCNDPFSPQGPWAPEWYNGKFSQSAANKVRILAGKVTGGINAVMRRAGVVTGTVTAPSGRKLARVCVAITTAKGVELNQAITKTDGTYRIGGLDPGRFKVVFVPACNPKLADFGSVWWPHSPTRTKAELIRVRLGKTTSGVNGILPRLGEITGVIRLGDMSGRPLAGMCISVNGLTPSATQFADGTSRRNGTYSIPGLSSGKYDVESNPGCGNNGNYAAAEYPHQVKVVVGKTTRGIDLFLQPGGMVTGTVTDAASNGPLGGICVSDIDGDFAVTNSEGSYRIKQMSAGTTSISFSGGCGNKGSYAPQSYDALANEAAATPVHIRAGETTAGIDAAMLPGATITGQVARQGGRQLGNVCVSAVSPSEIRNTFLFIFPLAISHKGRYTIRNLAPGLYGVTFWSGCTSFPNVAVQEWFKDQPSYLSAGLVSAPAGITAGLNEQLSQAGSISGSVADGAGNPLDFACVTATKTGTGSKTQDQTFGFDGYYQFAGLMPGTYTVTASDCGYRGLQSQTYGRQLVVRAGHSTNGINFKLRKLQDVGAIAGKVSIRSTGAPAKGVCLIATAHDGKFFGFAVTNRLGDFKITDLSPARYRVTIQTVDGCEQRTENLAGQTLGHRVRVLANRTTSGVNAALGQGGSLSGTVTGPGAVPVPGACVEAFPVPRGPAQETLTDRNGKFKLKGLTPDQYKVRVNSPFCSVDPSGLSQKWYNNAQTRAAATPVAVARGQVVANINATVGEDGTISGSVTGPASTPLTGVCVAAVPESPARATLYTVTSNGSYSLADVQPGRYRVEFESGCGATGWASQWWNAASSRVGASFITVRSAKEVSNIDAVMSTAS